MCVLPRSPNRSWLPLPSYQAGATCRRPVGASDGRRDLNPRPGRRRFTEVRRTSGVLPRNPYRAPPQMTEMRSTADTAPRNPTSTVEQTYTPTHLNPSQDLPPQDLSPDSDFNSFPQVSSSLDLSPKTNPPPSPVFPLPPETLRSEVVPNPISDVALANDQLQSQDPPFISRVDPTFLRPPTPPPYNGSVSWDPMHLQPW